MSINKQQAALLAEGLLDGLGTSKDDLRPKDTLTELIVLAGDFVISAQDNLNKSNANASGMLSESLVISDPRTEGKIVTVDVTMNAYGQFVNKGVKGTKAGKSNAGFAFKNDLPSKNMVDAIREWIKTAGLSSSSSDVKKYGAYGKNEKKNSSVSQLDRAYAVARSIKQKGLKPTGFLDKAEQETISKVEDRLGAAFRIDIINSIKS